LAISATAGSGYRFSSWSSSTGSITFASSTSASTTTTISGTGTITANFITKANPTVPAPTVSPNPDAVNHAVTVSVTVSGGSGTPTGTAAFQYSTNGGTAWIQIGSALTLSGSGDASTTYTPTTTGTYLFRVVYSGDGTYNGLTGSSTTLIVNGAPQTLVLRPSGSGHTDDLSSQGSSSNWRCVDESTSDGDNTYVYRDSGSSERFDTYEIEASSLTLPTITSITVHVVARVSSGSGVVRECIRIGGTNYFSTDTDTLTGSYVDYTYTWTNNPNTGSAWTWANINALEAGVALTHYYGSSRCTQVYVEVNYIG
jgi:hypothetical protein